MPAHAGGRQTLGAQLHLVGETLRRTLTLCYPAAKSLLAVGVVVLVGPVLFAPLLVPAVSPGPLGVLVVVVGSVGLLYVLGPILGVTLDVAYCYELHTVGRGGRPIPGSGLVFALRRLPGITLGALAVSGTFLAGYVTGTERLRVGSGVLDTLLAPALVVEDGSVRDILYRIDAVSADQWGSARLAVYGVGTLGRVVGTLGIGGAVGVVAARWVGVLPVATTWPQALLLAVAVFLTGLAFVTFVKSLVDGPVALALYEQATTAERPERLNTDAIRDVR